MPEHPLVSIRATAWFVLPSTKVSSVVPVPGASALLSALSASGLPTDEFRFLGFFPPRQSARRKTLEQFTNDRATLVAYESPHRILETLSDMDEISEIRPVVLARELTKLHEDVRAARRVQSGNESPPAPPCVEKSHWS